MEERSLKLVAGVVLGGVGVACVAAAAKRSLRKSARQAASSPFEYHLAIHAKLDLPSQSEWTLVKLHKAADLVQLKQATSQALGLEDSQSLQFYIVARDGAGRCARLGLLTQTSSLQAMQLTLPSDVLQVVELICTTSDPPAVSEVPTAAAPFPLPGPCLPLMGTTYQVLGPDPMPMYNLSRNVFPPRASKFPYGSTVGSYNGGRKEAIGDFPPNTIFHDDAHTVTILTASASIVEELIARAPDFPKLWNRRAQIGLQDFTENGLFTSSETSEDWKAAHSLLPRGFNQIKIKNFAPQILAKTRAFIREWSHFRAGQRVEGVNDWLTAMTADAVVTCSMGFDMRNVERLGAKQPPHKFVDNFRIGLGVSTGSINASSEYGWKRHLPFFNAAGKLQAKYKLAKSNMQEQVEQMVEATREGEMGGQNSIIRAMLEDRTGDGRHIRYGALYGHVVNLMIAGHETTAATLGFTMQLLAQHPEYEARALQEVREVLQGKTEPSVDDVPKLQFVEQCFREALRLYSPVTSLTRDAAHDTLLGGHRVYQGQRIVVVTRALHTNPEYWGGKFGDPLSFNPDRFSPDAVKDRHPNAYHPWGFATRSCIGSQFALFEAKTFLASMLLHFRLEGIPGYEIVASTHAGGAAPSPKDLAFIVYPRPGGPLWSDTGLMQPLPALALSTPESPEAQPGQPQGSLETTNGHKEIAEGPVMKVLYGSNAGSSQEFASQVVAAAGKAGFQASLETLDAAVSMGSMVPDGRTVIVVTSTYNGLPPDNACHFKEWLVKQRGGALNGLQFAVFGVGNSQWHTYQQFPREVDAGLHSCGGTRICGLGACDVDSSSFDSDFEDWLANLLQRIGGASGGANVVSAEDDSGRDEFMLENGPLDSVTVQADVKNGVAAINDAMQTAAKLVGEAAAPPSRNVALEVVLPSRELCKKPDARSVRHVTLRLPEDHPGYQPGDHLEVLPPNDPALVQMVLDVLQLREDAAVRWNLNRMQKKWRNVNVGKDAGWWEKLPSLHLTAGLVLQYFPDLASPPGRKACAALAQLATNPAARDELVLLGSDAEHHKLKVASVGLSLAELIHGFKGNLECQIGDILVIAKPLAPRRYSVSSNPESLQDKRFVTVTVGQVKFTTGTGRVHRGLASTRLGNMEVGDAIPGNVKTMQSNFHLPEDRAAPIIMVGPGTGLAPMMGFLQQREALLKKGTKVGHATLFFGCRSRDEDYLYQEELEGRYLKSGALSTLHVAFSRESGQKVYVQDKIWEERDAVWRLLQDPKCTVFVCGDARAMAPDVKRAFQKVVESGGNSSSSAANMIAAMVQSGRYVEDVWA
eukprot:CAMPEP_0181426372 /NCGR_PEP_ID=MMETSP1110-20121109/15629_1 /TAXON_ID=174948 /ORGANISM="Symbiodinium sp., Strain CCMP421" /LENGTH=1318 /DNA_ID=CAMNT_0023549565 /DNA_START=78 /DNA_END=4034 /DNA_ORIENTATION=+